MIYLAYVIVAAVVVVLSIRICDYVDILDKNTRLTGAFLGGILLSGVTSLPELFTSVSATALLKHPELCVGNVLGSNLFNLVALSAIILLLFPKKFAKGRVSKCYRNVALVILVIYGLIALNYLGILNLGILHMSITSFLIVVVYLMGAKYLAIVNDVDADEDLVQYQASKQNKDMPTEKVVGRFFLTAIGLVISSVLVTVLTNEISDQLDLTKTISGAILLGVATSIPEVTSTLRLFNLKNYNIAVGNIVGSNLFNFLILVAADMVSLERGVYMSPEFEVIKLLVCGAIATTLLYIMLKFRNKKSQTVCTVGIIVSYVAFLLVG